MPPGSLQASHTPCLHAWHRWGAAHLSPVPAPCLPHITIPRTTASLLQPHAPHRLSLLSPFVHPLFSQPSVVGTPAARPQAEPPMHGTLSLRRSRHVPAPCARLAPSFICPTLLLHIHASPHPRTDCSGRSALLPNLPCPSVGSNRSGSADSPHLGRPRTVPPDAPAPARRERLLYFHPNERFVSVQIMRTTGWLDTSPLAAPPLSSATSHAEPVH